MYKILVVDDEELARFTLREILESAGNKVDEARNGQECLQKCAQADYDAVVTDIIMPDKEGIETIIDLRRDYPDLKIVAISGGGRTRNMDFLELASSYGANGVLAKPFSDHQLLDMINGILK